MNKLFPFFTRPHLIRHNSEVDSCILVNENRPQITNQILFSFIKRWGDVEVDIFDPSALNFKINYLRHPD